MLDKFNAIKDSLPLIEQTIVSQFSTMIQSLPEEEKNRLRTWVASVQEIQHGTLNSAEKVQKLEALQAPSLIYDIFKSSIAHFAESKSISNKHTVKNVLDTAQMFIRPRAIMIAGLIGIGLNKVIPQVLVRPEAETMMAKLGEILGPSTGTGQIRSD